MGPAGLSGLAEPRDLLNRRPSGYEPDAPARL